MITFEAGVLIQFVVFKDTTLRLEKKDVRFWNCRVALLLCAIDEVLFVSVSHSVNTVRWNVNKSCFH